MNIDLISKYGELESDLLKNYFILKEDVAEDCEDLPIIELNEKIDFVSSGLAFPYTTSSHDIRDKNEFVLVRYRYAGRSTPKRDFCKNMISDKKVYRKEDIIEMGRQPVNPGFGPDGDDTYSIWLYKGGANCKHFWSRVVFVRQGFDVSSIKRIGINNVNVALPTIESEVETRPYDMPNRGYLMNKNKNKIVEKEVYIVDVDELSLDTGMKFISLVDEPAMELDWIALNNEVIELAADVDKKLLYGVFIVADKLIYRKGLDGYVKFTKENIEKLVKKWSKNNFNRNVNLQHTDKMVDAFVREYWIVEDTNMDKINNYIKNVPQGSLVGVIEIEDEKFWKDYIKTGILNGFSIEIIPDNLIKDKVKLKAELSDNQIKDSLYEILFKNDSSIDEVYDSVKKLFNI